MEGFDPDGLTELPFNLPGQIYRSPMPFRSAEDDGGLFRAFQSAGIQVIVVLAESEECQRITSLDLLAFYRSQGLEVIHCPIPDYDIPQREPFEMALEQVKESARAGKNMAVHCYGGFGRTGMFMACLAKKLLGMKGEEAVKWVRRYIPTAVENEAQVQFVREYAR